MHTVDFAIELISKLSHLKEWLGKQKTDLKRMRDDDDDAHISTVDWQRDQIHKTKQSINTLSRSLKALKYDPFEAETFHCLHSLFVQHMRDQKVQEYRRVLDRMITVIVHIRELNGMGTLYPYEVTVEDKGLSILGSTEHGDEVSDFFKFSDIKQWEALTPDDKSYTKASNPDPDGEFYAFD